MLNIVLFGPPGAGKGTQAELLKQKYNLIHLSTGEVIRGEIRQGTELGRLAESQMQGGALASDELVTGIIENFIRRHAASEGVIYDGFPRTLPQAEAFDKMLGENNETVTVMLALEIDDHEIITRITERAKISGRKDDQNEDTIRERIEVYNRRTAIVAEYYSAQGKYIRIDGMGSVDEVFGRLVDVIDSIGRQ